MSTLGDGLNLLVFIKDKGVQFFKWLKGEKRRKDVQSMEKAINSGDNAAVNDKLDKLHNNVKNKADSK